jgi:hypothetical protein
MELSKTPVLFLFLCLLCAQSSAQLFPVKKNNKWGLMNTEGKLVRQPLYDAIGEFKQFGYAVMQRGGKVGMLNDAGEEIVPPKYTDLKALDSTLISVMKEGVWEVVNLEGKVILKPGYDRVEVLKKSRSAHNDLAFLAFSVEKKWGLVDAKGRVIAVPRYDEISLLDDTQEGAPGFYFQTKSEGLLGLLLPNGFEALSPQAEEIRLFSEELFFFKKYRKWGAVNRQGKEVLTAMFDHFGRLSENFVRLAAENKHYLFSLVYNTLISNGEFETFYPFSADFALCKKNRLLGLIDHCGSLVLSPRYNEIQAYEGDSFRANLNGKWGVVRADDEVRIGFEYDYISPTKSGLCVVIQNRNQGIANAKGEIVVVPAYERVELEADRVKAYKKDQFSVLYFNSEGQLQDENNFTSHFKIRVTGGNDNLPSLRQEPASPYQLDKFEWFYAPRQDKWGLRRLDNGTVQIEPTFHEVRVERELGLTLVGIEIMQELEFDRTAFRFEMAYGLVKNDTGLLVHEVDLIDIRLSDFDRGLPVARCIFTDGRHGLVNRIGKVLRKDLAFVGDFCEGVARTSPKGKISVTLDRKAHHMGSLRGFLKTHLAPVKLMDYTQYDLDIEKIGRITCDDCSWGYVDTAGQMVVQPQYVFAKDFINDVGIVASGSKWGMVNKKGKELLPCRYDELGFVENTGNKVLRIFKKEEKYGLIDTLGRLAVGVHYEEIGSFSEGRLAVKRKGLWGFVDRNGREVVPCRFDEVSAFSEEWAAVKLGGKWGYIDRNGNVTLDFRFSKAGKFNGGLAPAKREGPHYGYIDRKGEWVIQPRFPKAHDFDRGVAKVEEISGEHFRVGLIDGKGDYIVKPKFVSLTTFNEHGLAVAGLGGSPVKYGVLNLKGALITSLTFREIQPYVEGLARVQHKDGYGFINTKGELAIPARFSKISDFSEGKAAVWLEGQCGFIDTLGNLTVPPQFSRCMDYKEGKAIVFKGNQRAGLIDTQGNFIIEPGINKLLDFAEGRGLVRDEHYKFYYITEQARFYDGYYEKASQFQHGIAVVQVDGRWAIINQQGIEIIPPKFDKIEQFENGFAKVRIKGFNGLTNLQGEMIVQPDYEYISYAGEGLFRVEQGDKIGYFDMEGKWVWGLQE